MILLRKRCFQLLLRLYKHCSVSLFLKCNYLDAVQRNPLTSKSTDAEIEKQIARLEKLSERRERLVIELFDEIKNSNFLTDDLVLRDIVKNLRNQYKFTIPQLKKNRTSRDFITYCLQNNY